MIGKFAFHFVILLCLANVFTSSAQTVAWAETADSINLQGNVMHASDAAGNVYACGTFTGLHITLGATTITNDSVGGTQMFLVKYDASGNVVWAKKGCMTNFWGDVALALDGFGHVFVTGLFNAPSISFGTLSLTNPSWRDNVFLVKYDTSGNALWARTSDNHTVWADQTEVNSIATDASGNVYLGGFCAEPSISFGADTLNLSVLDSGVAPFLVKYDSSGSATWVRGADSMASGEIFSVATDNSGSVFVTGYFNASSITFGATTLLSDSPGTANYNIFLVKYSSSGDVLWAKHPVGCGTNNIGTALAIDQLGEPYLSGVFTSSTLSFGTSVLTNDSVGTMDVFFAKYDTAGNVIWAKQGIGKADDYTRFTYADGVGNLYISGAFNSPSLVFGADTIVNNGTTNAFLLKYDSSGAIVWAKGYGGTGSAFGASVSGCGAGQLYMLGGFTDPTITFDTCTRSGTGSDMFLIRIDNVTTLLPQAPKSMGGIKVYPNPNDGNLIVDVKDNDLQEIEIVDFLGRVVYSGTCTDNNVLSIHLPNLPNGLYDVMLSGNGKRINERFVIQK
jgi:Secretion system C-terminal sorting domain